jgi:hypothetical protein
LLVADRVVGVLEMVAALEAGALGDTYFLKTHFKQALIIR